MSHVAEAIFIVSTVLQRLPDAPMTTRRMFSLPLMLLVVAALAGCEVGPENAAPSPPEEVADSTPPDVTGRDPKGPDAYQVTFDTTEGEVVIDVDRNLSPRGADRFYLLVKEGFYDGAKFFRVLPGFMAQVGIAADPKVHAKWGEANIQDDLVKASNTPGMVSFAKTGMPNSRSTQIFINYGDNSGSLDPQGFSPFGRVSKGMEVVEKLYSEYGEGAPQGNGPSQGLIQSRGNAYLDVEFPELDAIKTARVTSENGKPAGGAGEAAAEQPAEGDAAASRAESEAVPAEAAAE